MKEFKSRGISLENMVGENTVKEKGMTGKPAGKHTTRLSRWQRILCGN